ALLSGAFVAAFDRPALDYPAIVWLSLLCLGVLSTGAAYIVYYWLIQETGTVRSSLVTYIIPIVGVTAGALFLREGASWNTVLGCAVILLGVGLVNGLLPMWRNRPERND